MLVLTRQTDESIIIGDSIEIIVVEVKGDKVRIGIKAPVTIPIYRKEIYEEIQKSNIAAAKMLGVDLRPAEELLKKRPDKGEKGTSSER